MVIREKMRWWLGGWVNQNKVVGIGKEASSSSSVRPILNHRLVPGLIKRGENPSNAYISLD